MAAILKPFFNIDIVGTTNIVKEDSGKVFFVNSGTNATEVLTLTANANNLETVTLGAKTYTFQATLTNVDGNVNIGASDAATIANLIGAITLLSGTPGTDYAAATTLHPKVHANVGGGTTMNVTAKRAGVEGNSLATLETMTSGSFAFPTMVGGATTPNVRNRDFLINMPQDDVDGGNYEFIFTDTGESRNASEELFTSWTFTSLFPKPFQVLAGSLPSNPYNSRRLLKTRGSSNEGVKLGGLVNNGPGGTVFKYPAGETINFVSWGGVWYSTPPLGTTFYGIGDFPA